MPRIGRLVAPWLHPATCRATDRRPEMLEMLRVRGAHIKNVMLTSGWRPGWLSTRHERQHRGAVRASVSISPVPLILTPDFRFTLCTGN